MYVRYPRNVRYQVPWGGYVLFVVDESNGLGGETANIVRLTSGQLAHILTPLSKW